MPHKLIYFKTDVLFRVFSILAPSDQITTTKQRKFENGQYLSIYLSLSLFIYIDKDIDKITWDQDED